MAKIKKIKFIEPKIKEIKELKSSEGEELEDRIDTQGFETTHPISQEEIIPTIKLEGDFQEQPATVREVRREEREDEVQARVNYFEQATRTYESGSTARPRRNTYNTSIQPAENIAPVSQTSPIEFADRRIQGQHGLGQEAIRREEIGEERAEHYERKRRDVHEGG